MIYVNSEVPSNQRLKTLIEKMDATELKEVPDSVASFISESQAETVLICVIGDRQFVGCNLIMSDEDLASCRDLDKPKKWMSADKKAVIDSLQEDAAREWVEEIYGSAS